MTGDWYWASIGIVTTIGLLIMLRGWVQRSNAQAFNGFAQTMSSGFGAPSDSFDRDFDQAFQTIGNLAAHQGLRRIRFGAIVAISGIIVGIGKYFLQ